MKFPIVSVVINEPHNNYSGPYKYPSVTEETQRWG